MVQKYDIEAACCVGMESHIQLTPDDDGEFVNAIDYDYVADENKRLLEDLDMLRDTLEDLRAAYKELKDKVTEAYMLY